MILITLAALATAAFTDPGPLAPARDGQVQCYEPDVDQKTCQSIVSYRFEANGQTISKAQMVLNDGTRIVVIAEDEVYVRNHAECSSGDISPAHILSIELDGATLSGDDLNSVRQELASAMQEEIGEGEYCSTYHPKPDGSMTTVVTVAGQLRPDFTSTMRWVRREDGWRLQP